MSSPHTMNSNATTEDNPFAVANREKKGALTVKDLLSKANYKSRFEEVLGARAPQFMASASNLSNTPALAKCEPKSVVASCFVAATLDLPVDKNLGFAWVVPYRDNKTNKMLAQFQMGWKGIVQLALRSGQYQRINAMFCNAEVFRGYDEIGEPVLDWSQYDPEKPVAGYFVGWKLVNGFVKACWWTKERVQSHAKRYSQAFRGGSGPWKTHFDEMALKTSVMNEVRRWGILSVEMRQALKHDQSVQRDVDADPEYIDGDGMDGVIEVKGKVQEIETTVEDDVPMGDAATGAGAVPGPHTAEIQPGDEPVPDSGQLFPAATTAEGYTKAIRQGLVNTDITEDRLMEYLRVSGLAGPKQTMTNLTTNKLALVCQSFPKIVADIKGQTPAADSGE